MRANGKIICALVILCLIFLINAVNLSTYFISEDFNQLPALGQKEPGFFFKAFYQDYLREYFPGYRENIIKSGLGYVRPIFLMAIKLNYVLTGMNPLGWRLPIVLMHCANSILIFLIINFLVSDHLMALVCALLFALSPTHPANLVYISGGLTDFLPTLFYLLSVYQFIIYRAYSSRRYYISSVIMCFLGMFCKESVMVLPLHIILYDQLWESLQAGKLKFKKVSQWFKIDKGKLLTWSPFLIILGLFLAARRIALGTFVGGYGAMHTQINIQVKLIQMGEYIRRTLLAAPHDYHWAFGPFDINFVNHWRASVTLHEGLIALFLMATLLTPLLLRGFRNRQYLPLMGFALLWIVLSYILLSIADALFLSPRRTYLMVIGISIMLPALIFSFYKKKVALFVSVGLMVIYGSYQWKYNTEWREAGLKCLQIVQGVEAAARHYQKGDSVILIDVPMYHKTAFVFWGNLDSALRKPFMSSEVFDEFNFKNFSSDEIKSILEQNPGVAELPQLKKLLEITPLTRPDMLNRNEKPPEYFMGLTGHAVHLLRWNDPEQRMEDVSEEEMRSFIRLASCRPEASKG
ncbi:MAG: glycosyltransferase family 39 protein [Acidobacteria bacterium]|nr:glycosyltransferase family 39 protein [Acidobacteriota bacterium]MBI3655163.1 glycosyltransferase family 39 protein [Acidobacteriota bacterium]